MLDTHSSTLEEKKTVIESLSAKLQDTLRHLEIVKNSMADSERLKNEFQGNLANKNAEIFSASNDNIDLKEIVISSNVDN